MVIDIPLVSIYVPSIRPQNWVRMYDFLSKNDASFEIIFVGHIPPTFELPNNIVFINSPVKPTQCAEIGIRHCRGAYCIFAQDDMVFNEHALDNLVKAFEDTGREDLVVSCTPYLHGKELLDSYYRFFPVGESNVHGHKRTSPITPIGGLYKTSVVRKLGGVDKNFIRSHWDIDLSMRLYSIGGICFFCKEAIAEEILDNSPRLCAGAQHDRHYLDSMWTMPIGTYLANPSAYDVMYVDGNHPTGVLLQHRLKPVDCFVEENLLTLSQGPKERWP